jgi:hypothetical protein
MEIKNNPEHTIGKIVYTLILIAFAVFGMGGI